MTEEKDIKGKPLGDEAPRRKDFLIVLIVIAVLIALAWVAYYKFHFGSR